MSALVTFSGLDGAGKTTLIDELARELRAHGRRVRVLTMYDDVSFYSRLRRLRDLFRSAGRSHAGSRAASAGTGPLYAIVRSAPVRRMAFFADVASLVIRRLAVTLRRDDVLILDRYLYDTLVDAADGGWPSIPVLLRLAPLPDVPILVDVDPAHAFARKGEYDVVYLARRRSVYRDIFTRIDGAVVVRNDDLVSATAAVRDAVRHRLG